MRNYVQLCEIVRNYVENYAKLCEIMQNCAVTGNKSNSNIGVYLKFLFLCRRK